MKKPKSGPGSPRFLDLSGMRFGSLVAMKYAGQSNATRRRATWLCRCECGRDKIAAVNVLRAGHCNQCDDCLRSKLGRLSTKHGKANSREYRSWAALVQRCRNPKSPDYPQYGGRGIRVCRKWERSFCEFYADMGDMPAECNSIDRIDTNGHYEPGNCRWATPLQQSGNTRRNVFFTHNGERLHASEWARRAGVSPSTLDARLRRGVAFANAIRNPYIRNRHNGKPDQDR